MNKNKVKNSKAITLIALVITIVVLIILAGVTINLTLSQNGIFNKAKDARELYINAQEDEQEKINEITEQITTGEFSNGENNSSSGNNGNTTPDKELAEITKDLKAGDYIKYNTGVTSVGENGVIICRVLYDAKSEYGLQIISDKNVEVVMLGVNGEKNWDKASVSYNNAINKLSTRSEKYINTTYVTDVRSVGSIPTLQDGKFVDKNSENIGPVKLKFTTTVETANNMKEEDKNYEKDQKQMEKINILVTGEEYWIASRYVESNTSDCYFGIRYIESDGKLTSQAFCGVFKTEGHGYMGNSLGLRPCFALKTDISITGGEGTSESPYTL